MAGPAFEPDACIALPTASIAVMGPQAAINAVFYNQLQAIEDDDARAAKTEELRKEYAEDIDILHLASELVIDAVVQPEDLRTEVTRRFALAAGQVTRLAGQEQPDHACLAAKSTNQSSAAGFARLSRLAAFSAGWPMRIRFTVSSAPCR